MPYQRIIDCSEVHLFEDPANGTNHIAIKAPESLSETGCLRIRVGLPDVTASPYAVADGDRYINVDDDVVGGPVTVNLPPVADSAGRELSIKKLGTTGVVTVDPSGSETIDGELTMDIIFQHDAMQIFSDGTAWWIH